MRRALWRLRGVIAVCLLALLTAQSAFLAVAIGRSRQDYGCLTFDAAQGRYTLDVQTGVALSKHYESPAPPSPYAVSAAWQVIYRRADGLSLERRADGRTYTLPLKGDLHHVVFSPNGRWLAYSWYASREQPPALTLIDLQPDPSGAPSLRQIEIGEAGESWAWSPKGALLRIRRYDGKALLMWSAAEERLYTFAVADVLNYYLWQTDNAERTFLYFTYREIGSEVGSRLHLADLTGERASYPLPAMPSDTLWSPHDRYVALAISRFPRWQIAIADAEGNWHEVALVAQRGDALSLPLMFWSADGETLFYLQDEGESPLRWSWIAYRVAERSYRTIVPNVAKRPYLSPVDPQRAVFTWQEAGKRSAALMGLDGSGRILLAEAADDLGDPYWSPDGKHAALVWATGRAERRVVRLSIANAQTGAVQTLSEGLWDARDLRWVAGGARLFFIAVRGDAQGKPVYSAELLDLGAGEQRVLLAGKEALGTALLPTWDSVQFWWREGEWLGVARYSAQGAEIFAYRVLDGGKTPVSKAVRLMSGQTFVIDPPFPQVIRAPNSDFATLKVGAAGDEQLYLIKPDGSWEALRGGLSGLGDPLWSPDGASFAFTQAVAGGQVTLEIIKANGAPIRRVEGYGGIFRNLRWTRCGYSE